MKLNPWIVVGIGLLLVVAVLVVGQPQTQLTSGQPGQVNGPDDAVQEAVLAAQTAVAGDETSEAIAKSQNATSLGTSYINATTGLQSTLASIQASTQAATINANTSVGVAGIQATAANAVTAAQLAAAQASDVTSQYVSTNQAAASEAASQAALSAEEAAVNSPANILTGIGNLFGGAGSAISSIFTGFSAPRSSTLVVPSLSSVPTPVSSLPSNQVVSYSPEVGGLA
jgi:hypothetical protein